MATEAPAKDTDRYFEEIGDDEYWEVENARTVTEADVVNFAGVTGDFHRLHVSRAFAETESAFGERIAHGNLVHCLTEAAITDRNPKAFSYGHDNLRFANPVFFGDTLSMRREVLRKEDYDEEFGRIVYRYETTNQDGETVLVNDHIKLVAKADGGRAD